MASSIPGASSMSPQGQREAFAALLDQAYRVGNPAPGRLELEANARFARQAPELIVALFSPTEGHKIPVWEQQLSCGAACFNLELAALANGYAAGWVTGWAAYSPMVLAAFGEPHERIAGFIFIGTPGNRARGTDASGIRRGGVGMAAACVGVLQNLVDPVSVLVQHDAHERRPPRLSPPARQHRRDDPRRPGAGRRSAPVGAQPRRRLRRQSADRRQGLSDLPGGRAGAGEARGRNVRGPRARPTSFALPSARTSSRIAGRASSRTSAVWASTPRIWSSARSPEPRATTDQLSHSSTNPTIRATGIVAPKRLDSGISCPPARGRGKGPGHASVSRFPVLADLRPGAAVQRARAGLRDAAGARPAGRQTARSTSRPPDGSFGGRARLDLPVILAHHDRHA